MNTQTHSITVDDTAAIVRALEIHGTEAGHKLEGKTLGDVSQSWSLFLRGVGVQPGDKLSKDQRKALSERFDKVKEAYLQSTGIATTVHGQAVELVRVGKVRLTGLNKLGVPTRAEQSIRTGRAATVSELRAWLDTEADKLAKRDAYVAALEASSK